MIGWKKLLAGLCAVGLFMTGCGSQEGSKTVSVGNANVLKVGVTNFADTLEPTQNYFGRVVMRYGLGECLTRFDDKMTVQPWLAESWSIGDDRLTWTFKIREGIKFSNGTPLTAEVVKASIERTFDKNPRATKLFACDSITADGQSLIIRTTEPLPCMPAYLADPLFIIVDTTAEPERDFATDGAICTGAYAVESYSKERAVMKRNDNYWDGAVGYPTIEIATLDDATARAKALEAGEVDVAVNIAANELDTFKGNDKFNVVEAPSLRVVFANLNQTPDRILNDTRIRAALIAGCDRATYNNVLLRGMFIAGKAPLPPSFDYGFDALTDPNVYNPVRAVQLLDEAGWQDTDGDGIREKDGQKLELDFVIDNDRAEFKIYAEAIQADLEKLGIGIKITGVERKQLEALSSNRAYDLLLLNLTAGDVETFLTRWRTNEDFGNPDYDAKLAQLLTEFDTAKRRQLLIELQQTLLDDGAALFLGYPKSNIVSAKHVEGVEIYPSDCYWLTKTLRPAQ